MFRLSDLGVILLMYPVGLEFNARKLLRAGPRSLLAVAFQGGVIFIATFLAARAFGWGETASVFAAAALCISSTMIAARLIEATRPPTAVRESVFSILVMQDLLAILLLAGLATAQGRGRQVVQLGRPWRACCSRLRLALGMLVVPRFVRWWRTSRAMKPAIPKSASASALPTPLPRSAIHRPSARLWGR
jgi:CPA2 family monovalent cation:H+ antiporter-2